MKFILGLLMTCILAFGANDTTQFKVIKVIDGDTIKVLSEDGILSNIRLAHVDTPEKYAFSFKAKGDIKKCGSDTLKMGIEASKYLNSLVKKGAKVDVKFIGETSHDRDVAIVYLNKVNINSKLVQDGYAIVWHRGRDIKDATYKAYLIESQDDSIMDIKGFWKTNPRVMDCLEEYHK